MKISLQMKIFFSFLVVIIVGVGVVGYLANRATVTEFSNYMRGGGGAAKQEIADELATYYDDNRGWKEVGETLNEISKSGYVLILKDLQGKIIAQAGDIAEAQQSQGHGMGRMRNQSLYIVDRDGKAVGVLSVFPTETMSVSSTAESSFLNAVNRSLIWAALLAVLISVILSFVLSRYISRPIKSLTGAVHAMAEGDLDQEIQLGNTPETQELSETFNYLAQRLKEVEELRRNMISDIAHELRTPLTALQGYVEGIEDGVIKPTKKNLQVIYDETMLLSRLVKDLQELSHLEAGQLSLEKKPIDIGGLVRQTMKSQSAQIKKSGAEVEIQVADNLPDLEIDKDRIRQVLANLVSNALRHSSKKGRIVVNVSQNQDNVEFVVSDNGRGISKKDLPFIFERFYRAEKSRQRQSGGAGLGLTIAKKLVEAHGGSIWADSIVGKGTQVHFTLPKK